MRCTWLEGGAATSLEALDYARLDCSAEDVAALMSGVRTVWELATWFGALSQSKASPQGSEIAKGVRPSSRYELIEMIMSVDLVHNMVAHLLLAHMLRLHKLRMMLAFVCVVTIV